MKNHSVKLPDIGEGVAEAEIVLWMVAVGDRVEADQPVAEVMTDKASVEIYAPLAGRVHTLGGEPGDSVAVGADLLVLELDGDTDNGDSPTSVAPSAAGVGTHIENVPPLASPGLGPLASPAVRKRALDGSISLADVPGSGPAGRISHDDLDAYIASRNAQPTNARPGELLSLLSANTAITEVKVIGLRRKIAQQMSESKRRIPHFAYVEEVDVSELENLRHHLNATSPDTAPKLTVLPFIVLALNKAIAAFPQMNARFDDDAGIIHQYAGLHCGIAAQTPNGLVVPVVHHGETFDIWGMAREISRLGEAARSGALHSDELSGSTITVTSLGPLGGIVTTPIINHPEVAILGVNKIAERPMVVAGEVAIRKMMNLSGSFDHRAVDGMDAAMFIQNIKAQLENPATIFISNPPA
jgi:2-oxoisovalerate dehydrogenase E2 component (dihydrolipoyl transacylase)